MGLPDRRKSFKIGLVVLIQYRLWQTASHPYRHVALASTRYAIALRLKTYAAVCRGHLPDDLWPTTFSYQKG